MPIVPPARPANDSHAIVFHGHLSIAAVANRKLLLQKNGVMDYAPARRKRTSRSETWTQPRRNQPYKVREEYRHNTSSQSKTVSENAPPPFSQRVDRYRRPFGERLPLPSARGSPLRNKLTPGQYPPTQYARRQLSPSTTKSYHLQDNRKDKSSPIRARPHLQWREKISEISPRHKTPLHASEPVILPSTRVEKPPLERNMALLDFPLLPPIPTTEQVLNELEEVTLQYTSCAAPTESAARR